MRQIGVQVAIIESDGFPMKFFINLIALSSFSRRPGYGVPASVPETKLDGMGEAREIYPLRLSQMVVDAVLEAIQTASKACKFRHEVD